MRSASPSYRSLGLDDELLRDRTGRGVRVAVLDSGVNADNPHVSGTVGGVTFAPGGSGDADIVDRLGHGTAVVAAIQEKAPGASLQVIKIFHDTLSSDTPTLIRALDRALEDGARLINLSLGTPEPERRGALRAAVERAVEGGALVVSAREHRGRRWWPGSLEGVMGVLLDWECPRSRIRLMRGHGGEPVVRASGYPRPVPGLSPARNLKGISFAVANATGILAVLLEAAPDVTTAEEVAEWIERA